MPYNITLAAKHSPKTRWPSLTTNWNSGDHCAVCRDARWYARRVMRDVPVFLLWGRTYCTYCIRFLWTIYFRRANALYYLRPRGGHSLQYTYALAKIKAVSVIIKSSILSTHTQSTDSSNCTAISYRPASLLIGTEGSFSQWQSGRDIKFTLINLMASLKWVHL